MEPMQRALGGPRLERWASGTSDLGPRRVSRDWSHRGRSGGRRRRLGGTWAAGIRRGKLLGPAVDGRHRGGLSRWALTWRA